MGIDEDKKFNRSCFTF